MAFLMIGDDLVSSRDEIEIPQLQPRVIEDITVSK